MNLLGTIFGGATLACAFAAVTGCSGSSDVTVPDAPAAAGDDDAGSGGAATGTGSGNGSAGTGNTSGGGGSSGGGGGGGGGADAGTSSDATVGGACNALVDDALAANVQEVATVAPTPTGGSIPNGTYHLVDISVFTGPGGTTAPVPLTLRSTVSVHGNTVDLVQDTGNQTQRMTETFVTSGTTVTFTDACPGTRPPATGQYSGGAGLVLFLTNGAGQVVTYTYQ